jgi:hypothetical protein
MGRCTRCGATGRIEFVEMNHVEAAALRANAKRFAWIVDEFAHASGQEAPAVIEHLDQLMEMGASKGRLGGRLISEILRACRGETARTKAPRTRAPTKHTLDEEAPESA